MRVCARDPHSQARLATLGITAELVAELAFLLEPDLHQPGGAPARAWLDRQRADGRRVGAVNINHLVAGRVPGLFDGYVDGLGDAGSAGTSWLLIPHDRRGEQGDLMLAERLHRRLDEREPGRAHVLHTDAGPAGAKALVGAVDMVLTGRMHLAVAAISQGVPPLAVGYQDKFSGLLESARLPAWCELEPAQACAGERLADVLRTVLAQAPALRRNLRAAWPELMALARRGLPDATGEPH